MKEVDGDLWRIICDARVITTNGTITNAGRGVMGKGVARDAKQRYLGVEGKLGRMLAQHGNHVCLLVEPPEIPLIAMPVKHEWHERADYDLIRRSAGELVELVDQHPEWTTVVMPRPGCGNGKLYWANVEKVIRPVLDDRFVVVCRGTGRGWEA